MRENDDLSLASRTLAAVIACLDLLHKDWEKLNDAERHGAVTLALEAGRRIRAHAPDDAPGP